MIALTNGSGAIEERYAYSAYGEPVFANASGTVLADSAMDNRYTYTGREWDEEVSLYHFRARMYDAESGRLCGRDPLGYVDEMSQYARTKILTGLDPEGTITITRTGDNLSYFRKCVEPTWIKWQFHLSKKAKDICPGGTGGWLVQHVIYSCAGESCPKDKACDKNASYGAAHYFEAWYVGPDDDTAGYIYMGPPKLDHSDESFTDISLIPASPGRCGTITSIGEVRFYCTAKSSTTAKPKEVSVCGKTFSSWELPASLHEPPWWSNRKSDDGTAIRVHTRDWNCCPDCPKPTKEDVSDGDP